MTSEPTVSDNPEAGRYEVHVDGDLAGISEYVRRDGVIEFTHTKVEDAYEGQGLAGRLAATALDEARADGVQVVPTCPYIRGYIEKHREYADLVGPGR